MRSVSLILFGALCLQSAIAGESDKKQEVKKPMAKTPAGLVAVITTDKGVMRIELFGEDAPLTVASFANLAMRGYFDGLTFHRVIANFMIQGGDPTGSGSGGPGYQFKNECTSKRLHDGPGVLSMANSGPGTNGSQFFITHKATGHLNGKHTVFGKIISGQDVVDSIAKGDSMKTVRIEGDYKSLLKKNQEQVTKWDNILDRRFPAKDVGESKDKDKSK